MAVAPAMLGLPAVPTTLSERVQRDADEAFQEIRGRVRAACWDALPDDPDGGEHARGPDGLLHEPGGFPVVTLDSSRRRVGSSVDLRPSSPRVRAALQIGR